MKTASLIPVGLLKRRVEDAEAAWVRKDFQLCLNLLESASRLAPTDIGIHLRLGRYYGLRYDYEAAGRHFEHAYRVAIRKDRILMSIVEHCQEFRHWDLSKHYLRRALNESVPAPIAYIKLAQIYERNRQPSEADQLATQALTTIPNWPAALLIKARLQRLDGKWKQAEQLLRSFLGKPIPDRWIHAQSEYELAVILDHNGEYEAAMEAAVRAKQLLKEGCTAVPVEWQTHQLFLKKLQTDFNSTLIRAWDENAHHLSPPCRLTLMCGYARSGTTLLEQVLDAHPELISAEETTVFPDDALAPLKWKFPNETNMIPVLEGANISILRDVRSGYFKTMERLLQQPIGHRMLLDKNPMFTWMIPAFIRIFPESKFVVALRDPRDVVVSRFMQAIPPNSAHSEYLAMEHTVEDYCGTMALWQAMKPLLAGRFLEVRYEDLVADLESISRKTLNFLGLAWNAKVLGFDEHARNKPVLSPTYADVTQKVYTRAKGRWRNYQKHLEPHLAKLEPFVKAFGYG